ncbi:MAG: hypothetical protein JWQ42_2444 [Edaphobacter sp.]|nr:hypothetical protein [Edaphobacter sp.]
MPRLNLVLPLVARVTRPLASDLLVSNSASIHSLNVLAGMSGFARDPRSLLLPSLFAVFLLSFTALVSGQTPQQTPKVPAAGAKSTPEKVQAKAAAGRPAKSGAVKAKPGAAAPKAPAAPKDVDKGIAITGDFRDLIADKTPSACHPSPKRPDCAMDACAEVLGQDYTIVGEVECLRLSEDQASIIYSTSQTAVDPVYLRLGKKNPPDVLYDFAVSKPAAKSVTVAMRQVVAADFCRRDKDGHCTTEFLKPGADPKAAIASAYVQAGGDSLFTSATVNAVGEDAVDVGFKAAADFKPAFLVLVTQHDAYRFAFSPASPTETVDMIFTSDDLESICNPLPGGSEPDCDHTQKDDVSLEKTLPDAAGSIIIFKVIQDHLLVTTWTGPMGQEPSAVVIANLRTHKSTVVRRTLKPGGNNNLLNVDMSIMDQTTAQRNYGNRMAKRYIAVTLDIKNPTSKKVQFNKSALYFDADYVEATERKQGWWPDFKETVATGVTMGLYQPSVYQPPFVASNEKQPRVARFNLEQNVKQSPLNYLAVLGSFDYTTEKTDEKLKALELFGSVLTNIATGGIVADASGAFRAGTSVFSGTFLPGVRGLVLDTPFINRLRSNLVAQTLQETVQVPAGGSTSTIVLLPRTGILAFTDAEVPVMIKRLIDVHLIPEVVSEITETPIQKGMCKAGYTKAQAREAFGEETGLTTAADGSSTFTYNKGPVASASFDVKGDLQTCKNRTLSEQLDVAATLAEASKILNDLSLSSTKIELTDGSTVLTDIPGVQQTYHFDSKGNRASDYVFLFKDIQAQEGKAAKSDFETFLEDKAKSLSSDRSTQIKSVDVPKAKGTTDNQFKYSSPDVKNGSLTATFEDTTKSKAVGPTSTLKSVTFEGDKPKNVQ